MSIRMPEPSAPPPDFPQPSAPPYSETGSEEANVTAIAQPKFDASALQINTAYLDNRITKKREIGFFERLIHTIFCCFFYDVDGDYERNTVAENILKEKTDKKIEQFQRARDKAGNDSKWKYDLALGNQCILDKNWTVAKEALERAYEVDTKINPHMDKAIETRLLLAKVNLATRNYAEAYKYAIEARDLRNASLWRNKEDFQCSNALIDKIVEALEKKDVKDLTFAEKEIMADVYGANKFDVESLKWVPRHPEVSQEAYIDKYRYPVLDVYYKQALDLKRQSPSKEFDKALLDKISRYLCNVPDKNKRIEDFFFSGITREKNSYLRWQNDFPISQDFRRVQDSKDAEMLYIAADRLYEAAYRIKRVGGMLHDDLVACGMDCEEYWKDCRQIAHFMRFKAAHLGSADANYELWKYYVPDKDYINWKWLSKISEGLEKRLNENGIVIQEPRQYLEKAAELGHLEAVKELNAIRSKEEPAKEAVVKAAETGEMVSKDIREAEILFVRAKSSDDLMEKIALLEQAESKGYAPSVRELALCYASEGGDPKKAFGKFLQSALDENVDSMVDVAINYRDGIGTEKDLAAARKWLEKASDAGHDQAKTLLQELANFENA